MYFRSNIIIETFWLKNWQWIFLWLLRVAKKLKIYHIFISAEMSKGWDFRRNIWNRSDLWNSRTESVWPADLSRQHLDHSISISIFLLKGITWHCLRGYYCIIFTNQEIQLIESQQSEAIAWSRPPGWTGPDPVLYWSFDTLDGLVLMEGTQQADNNSFTLTDGKVCIVPPDRFQKCLVFKNESKLCLQILYLGWNGSEVVTTT